MVSTVETILAFVIALIISTVIIYVVAKLLGETEDIKTALIAALIGTVVYTIIYALLGSGWIAALLAGIAWLLALQVLLQNRLDQIPDNCCCHMDSDNHCRMVPANAHGPVVKKPKTME